MDINKLPFDKYKEGLNTIIDNAENLLNSGSLLLISGQYGLANSVFILSCEEAIKAFAVYNKLLVDDDRDIRKVFKSHKEKLTILKAGYHLMKSETLAMKESFDQAFSESPQGKRTPDKEIEKRATELHPEKYREALSKTDAKDDTWWDSADESKQQGFYVGYKDGKWQNPKTITRKQAKETGERALFVVNHITIYRNVDVKKFKSVKNNAAKS